ncbi:eukaryotic translation initiation factor 4E1-like [Sitodiplosis mosellana]|uniref:eukaryotic translation initiation factor 4E1-like n=1 Tax=Sitodiplosis mosellana TaxID=263140 RepID=UPI002444A7E4|nr:eukaryotic translation initiation factor 4E1-like [Sitodiplosis mosellana]
MASNLVDSCVGNIEVEAPKPSSPKGEWSLWYFEKECGKAWDQCFHEVAACKSIGEFWILFNSIKLPTEINEGCNYALFRSNIRPMWEDEHNQNGGRWIITLEKRVDSDEVNRLWLDTLLLLVEERLSDSSTVCGVIFHNRWKFTKIAIWVAASTATESFRREIRTKLRLADSVPCVFENHWR